MTEVEISRENPIGKLKEALLDLRLAHEDVVEEEARLDKLRNKLNSIRIDLKSIYTNAASASEALGEPLATDFMDGQILVQFDDDHRATVKHIPHMETFRLITLARRVEKNDTPSE